MSIPLQIIRPLASGGNADLCLARRSDTGRYVVVKYLRDWQLPLHRERFEHQISVLRRGVQGWVPVLDWNLTAQQPCYVMPFFEGGTLARHAGRLAANQLHAVAVRTARALRNLHAVFEVDGDYKPDNVLVTQAGHIFVGDPLGNGSIFTRLFRQNQGGTPGYRAPEIRNGGTISRAGDSYAFGVTLHHLLSGRPPVEGKVLNISAEEYKKAPKICEVIIACCQFDPNARPSMDDVLRVLAGESWTNIQAHKAAQREAAGVAILIGLAFVGVAALAS
jgi:serine/threonine protein kinase